VKASVSCSSSADSRVFSARCVTLRLLLAFIHFNHKFQEHSQERPHHWAALDPVSSPWGALLQLASQTKLPAPKIEIWNTINQWSVCQFWECQAPLHKRKTPTLKTFWTIHWSIYESIQSCIKQPASLLGYGTELKIFALARLWQLEWTVHCSNNGCLVDHTSPAQALLDIRNNAITQMFGDQQNKLGYCHRTVMVEVAKPIIMADVVHQGL